MLVWTLLPVFIDIISQVTLETLEGRRTEISQTERIQILHPVKCDEWLKR